MANAPSFHDMAPDAEASSAMDIGKRCLSQNTNAERTDLTRPSRLFKAEKMEDVPEAIP
jgi:hypothetical protein